MSIPRGTTPTFTLTFDDEIDLTSATDIYVTFSSDGNTVTKTGGDLDVSEKTISVSLSQEDTFLFEGGIVEIQANWLTVSGKRVASKIAKYPISRQLLMRVI